MRKLIASAFIFFPIYTLFWLHFFSVFPFNKTINFQYNVPVQKPQLENSSQFKNVLASTDFPTSLKKENPPESYFIELLPRKQAFNLSCEFAAAASIINFFTNDPTFAAENEETAEEKLISKIDVSQNPNVGIRMGDILEGDFRTLLKNLNKKFGGEDYYGVHAPPFIDLFAEYGLLASPIAKDENVVFSIQRAISSGHLVMAWIKIGYGQAVDAALSYGTIPIIRGEHTVVINGYDEKGVILMDPGTGSKRNLAYGDLLKVSGAFPMPFLQIYLSPSKITLEDVYGGISDKAIGIPREKLTILVENGSRKFGRGNQLADILRDFGYRVTALNNADNFDYEDITIRMKKNVWDYRYLLQKDLRLAAYSIATISADLTDSASTDALVIIGN